MASYHVGCGAFGIYAGTLNKRGDMWVNKSEVTEEAIGAVAQYLIDHNEGLEFSYHGKRYRLGVTEMEVSE